MNKAVSGSGTVGWWRGKRGGVNLESVQKNCSATPFGTARQRTVARIVIRNLLMRTDVQGWMILSAIYDTLGLGGGLLLGLAGCGILQLFTGPLVVTPRVSAGEVPG